MPKNTYVALKHSTLVSAASSVSFTSISQDYTDLVLVCNAKVTTGNNNIQLEFNGDSTTAYSVAYLYGNGSSNASSGFGSTPYSYASLAVYGSSTEDLTTITNIQGYSNTSKHKRIISEAGRPGLGREILTGSWRSNSAITSIVIRPAASTFPIGSTFSLYGIQASGLTPSTKATGGAIYSDDTYYYHAFGSSGTFTPTQSITADILVVAGGGQGGGGNGGGGGAGGLRAFTSQSLTATNYTVTVGGGGSGGSTNNVGGNGSNSQFGALTVSTGGGGGGGYSAGAAASGGSGGGGGTAGNTTAGAASPSGQGNAGGNAHATDNSGGGGGGAGAAGGTGTVTTSGTGGNGSSAYSSWGLATGTGGREIDTYYYAGGGSGGGDAASGNIIIGAAGFGGGGLGGSEITNAKAGLPSSGGGGGGEGGGGAGANGGSGVVIVRYAKV